MEIIQRKSKDAELAKTVYVRLEQVQIPGWKDEDDQPVTSAVILQEDPPASEKKSGSKIDAHRKTFENAWWSSGCEERNGLPYLSRSAMVDYLVQKMDVGEASARQYIKPSATGRPIADLLVAEIIEAFEHGWTVVDESQASAMLIRKGER